jgi:hypothetical protein
MTIKTCDQLKIEENCKKVNYSYLGCVWTGPKEGGKCKLKSSVKCTDLTLMEQCTNTIFNSLNCDWTGEKEKGLCGKGSNAPLQTIPKERKPPIQPEEKKSSDAGKCGSLSSVLCTLRPGCTWNKESNWCLTKRNCSTLEQEKCEDKLYKPLNCGWTGTKCLLKSSIKCSDFADSQKCTEDKSMSCVWEAGPTVEVNKVKSTQQELKKTGLCKPRSEARCESIGKDKNSCDAEKKRCFWSTKLNHNYCWGKDEKITKCSDLKNSLCENWAYEYLNCKKNPKDVGTGTCIKK